MIEEHKENLVKEIRDLAITKQLNILIGSGTSLPAIPLMNMIKKDNIEERNEELSIITKRVSTELINNETEEEIESTLKTYISFLSIVIEILNLSNSRQTPRTVNLFTTNYDLFIEKAVDTVLSSYRFIFNDGASGYFDRKLDSSNYNRTVSYRGLNDNYTNEIPSLTLIKPHGSMNWEMKDESISIRNHVVDDPYIVKPTGYEEQETFLSNHFHEMLRVFQLELDKPQTVLFIIGFSFQDKHIAKMIRRAIQNPELIIYVFSYREEDKNIYLSNLGFTEERKNFRILTPQDFEDHFKVLNEEDNQESWYSFTLKNLTDLLRGANI